LLLLDLPLLAGNVFMTGSRGSAYTIAFVVVGFMVAAIFMKLTVKNSVIMIIGGGSCLAVLAASFFFADAVTAWTARATHSDSFQSRVMDSPLKSFGYAFKDGGFVGYGIGMTHPAVDRLRNALEIPRPAKPAPTYDMEAAQVLVEVGFFGFFAWYTLRLLILYQSFISFLKCPPGSLRTLLLAAFLCQVPFMEMSLVLNHFANVMVCACYGLSLIPRLESTVRRRTPVRVEAPAPAGRDQRRLPAR
jgi:hypothetical protein